MFACSLDSIKLPRCFACGGNKSSDEYIRSMNQCDGPGPKKIPINIGGRDTFTYTCPRKVAQGANKYWRYWRWREKNSLEFICDPDMLPAKVANALDLIDDTISNIKANNYDKAQKEREKRRRSNK